jgi:hypothetical protein
LLYDAAYFTNTYWELIIQGMLKVMKDPSGALSFRAVLKKEMEVYVDSARLLMVNRPEYPFITGKRT